ncbi:hypothetical protein SAMN05444166_5210 [Singulisphaera sp. GP187]|uniref:hypothetical protein n=1 Tax=Singulisphaera sp. GP187 TaxID=1882752 RepID=UPI0009280C10|nr:hypothetical protein [Singulisphaera sp. GP187]SIO56268.1 hypothetical protein SAMN05444166_5210 [Singulisphaera sp. GP187]
MRRLAVLLSLFAALTGTPLRQAEAADDFARSFSQWFQPATLQTLDGGVGDDSGVVTLTQMHGDFAADALLVADPFILPPLLGMPSVTPEEAEGLKERVWWPPAPPNIRHAWLQIFLF